MEVRAHLNGRHGTVLADQPDLYDVLPVAYLICWDDDGTEVWVQDSKELVFRVR